MKLNNGGLKFCAAYAIIAAWALILAYFAVDPWFRFFLLTFVWLPARITFGILHLNRLLAPYDWNWFLGPPVSLLTVYLVGWAHSAIANAIKNKMS
jgi:hypothetical protein